MSVVHITIPADLELRSVPDRLLFWSRAYAGMPEPNRRLIALLEEAATEITLGQTTRLTYRGDEMAQAAKLLDRGDALA